MNNKLFFVVNIIAWSALLRTAVIGKPGIHPIVLLGHPDNPGIKIRLTQTGIDYVNQMVPRVMNKKIPEMQIPSMEMEMPGGQGKIRMTDVRTHSYKAPSRSQLSLVPSNKLHWTLNDMDLGIRGKMDGRYGTLIPVDLKGDVTAVIRGIDFSLLNAFEATPDGKPSIRSVSCSANARSMDLKIENGGLIGGLINAFKDLVIQVLRPILLTEVCRVAESVVNGQANDQLQTLPTLIPLSLEQYSVLPGRGAYPRPSTLNVSFLDMKNISPEEAARKPGLWLNYGLVKDPRVTSSYVEAECKGEVSWRAKGRTPFGPAAMFEGRPAASRMLSILASDFIPNSMMYHAYRNGLLRFDLKPENPDYGSFLQTTCFGEGAFEVCIGDVLPALAEEYPDRKTEIVYYPTRAPAFLFTRKGTVNLDSQGVLYLYLQRPGRFRMQLISTVVDLQADTKLNLKDQRVTGEVTLKRFNLRLKRSRLEGVTDSELAELSDFAGSILEGVANEILAKGIPLPLIQGGKLVNPSLRVSDRLLTVETDVEVDESLLSDFADQAFQNGIRSFSG